MKKTKVGIAGLGRLGKEHAENLKSRIRSAELVAACSIMEEELKYAREELEIETTYSDYDEMLNDDQIEMVVVVTSSNIHADCIIKALKKKKHVFCEKPLALNLEDCYRVKEEAVKHPELKLSVGFNRRFDPSYYQAYQKIKSGDIGQPVLIYQQTVDIDSTAEFQIQFSKTGGGWIVDANIHDFDLVHWLMGSPVKEVYAAGGAYAYPGFAEFNDVDNVSIMCRLENQTTALITGSRTAFHGHSTQGFIRGTKGEISVGRNPNENRLETFDQYGVRFDCVQTFFDRFRESFQLELESFIDSVQNNLPTRVDLDEAIMATKAAFAGREALISGKLVEVK